MPVLIIGDAERENIKRVIEQARAHPLPMSLIAQGGTLDDIKELLLRDRKPGFERPESAYVEFPGDYRAAFSIEEQPMGLCTHLSISVFGRRDKGQMPHPAAVQMIADAFDVPYPPNGRIWVEEFEPGEFAVNLVSLETPYQEGHA